MKVYDTTGKLMFFVLHYEFPNNVVKTEKYKSFNQFNSRVKQLKRYEKMGSVSLLVH